MHKYSTVIILGVGLFVLVAQLVVWLTPARNLLIDVSENRADLEVGSTSSPAGSGRLPSTSEPLSPNEERARRTATIAEPAPEADALPSKAQESPASIKNDGPGLPADPEREANGSATNYSPGEAILPAPVNEIGGAVPAGQESEIEKEIDAAGGAVPLASPEERAAEAPKLREKETDGDGSPPRADDMQVTSDGTAVQTPSLTAQDSEAVARAPDTEGTQLSTDDPSSSTASEPKELFIADAIRLKLSDADLTRDANPGDLAAVEAFYEVHDGPALWLTTSGFSPEGKLILGEMASAHEWGLDSEIFAVPPPDYRPMEVEDQAATEIALSLAILQYARAARGGLTEPSTRGNVFDLTPPAGDSGTVLTEIAAASAPNDYLTDLHPKHEQFGRLRQALLKAHAKGDATPDELHKLRTNMDRWRWMPADLGTTHVWLNIPEFMLRVVKDGTAIHSEKAVVGSPNKPTPVLSADLKSIIFNPYRTVPPSIIRKNVLPSLQKSRGLFRGSDFSILEQYQLEVRRDGKPVDPSKIDWENVNLSKITFVQAPGPTNTLGKAQFVFPNTRGIEMHETIVPNQLERAVRAQGERSPRVGNPEKLASVLLAEGKGWESAKVVRLIADTKNKEVKLDNPIPVHLTYFTAVVDDEGRLKTIDDVYKLDMLDKPETASSSSGPAPAPSRKPVDGNFVSNAP